MWLHPALDTILGTAGYNVAEIAGRYSIRDYAVLWRSTLPGQRLHALGIGPQSIMRKDLTAQRLAQTIAQAITDEEMQCQAAQRGEQIRAEDGIATGVTIITQYLSGKELCDAQPQKPRLLLAAQGSKAAV